MPQDLDFLEILLCVFSSLGAGQLSHQEIWLYSLFQPSFRKMTSLQGVRLFFWENIISWVLVYINQTMM